jgi:hypothetical protein
MLVEPLDAFCARDVTFCLGVGVERAHVTGLAL